MKIKKTTGLAVWAAVLVIVLIAAYTFYEKYKSRTFLQPPAPNIQQSTTQHDTTADRETEQDGTNRTEQEDSSREGQDDTNRTDQNDVTGDTETGAPDKIMAPDFTLKDLSGNDISLSDYEGKIVILNFWALWCRYCIEEMPDFNTLDKELEQTGDAVILTVNVQDSAEAIQDYLTKNSLDLKVLLDEDGIIASTYGISGFPTTFMLNPDGSLYTYIPGKTDIETLRKLLDMMLNGEPLNP